MYTVIGPLLRSEDLTEDHFINYIGWKSLWIKASTKCINVNVMLSIQSPLRSGLLFSNKVVSLTSLYHWLSHTPSSLPLSPSLSLSLFLSLTFLVERRGPEEEGRVGDTAVAEGLVHQSIQDVHKQEHSLAVSRYSVGEGCPCVERRSDVRELSLRAESGSGRS